MAGRYGGDEFLVVLPQINMEGGLIAAERIRKAIDVLRIENGLHVTVSAGIASYASGVSDDFIKIADERLYRAKAQGRNRIAGE